MSTLDDLLQPPSAPNLPPRMPNPEKDFTRQVEVSGDAASAVVRDRTGSAGEGAARDLLRQRGEDPDQWVVTGYRSSEWTMANGELGESNRYTFARVGTPAADLALRGSEGGLPDLDELFLAARAAQPAHKRPDGDHAFIVAIGDTQFGKIDGDGVEGAVDRTVANLAAARDSLAWYRRRYDIGHVHIAWLGDHIEGFVSQGGGNVWRTQLSLNEQIRLSRRVMLYALELFAPAAKRVSMAAVPGNHGEPQRFSGKGVTRYDDSHDTESLIAVSEAAAVNPRAFGHCEFYVPSPDEMTVTLDLAGTITGHAHGHQWRPGKHFAWWQGQSFGGSPLANAQLLLAGHLHHEHIEANGTRLYVQVPALEAESTWYRHSTGTPGNPGLLVMITRDGRTSPIEVIR